MISSCAVEQKYGVTRNMSVGNFKMDDPPL